MAFRYQIACSVLTYVRFGRRIECRSPGSLTVRLQMCSEQTAVGDEAAAEGALLMIVLRQGAVEIARRGRESVDERLSVEGCFTDAGGYMRSGNEGSITEECNAPEDDPRRFQIEDSLK